MAREIINIGAAPDDGTGDPLRVAFEKINSNFQELYGSSQGGSALNVYYVSKSGNDSNPGNTLGEAFLTVRRAVQVATAYLINNPEQRVCIFVKSGEYIEQNPIIMPPKCAIWGDSVRSVSIKPTNPTQDILQIQNEDYVTGITFRDHLSPAAAISFPSSGTGAITVSPYVQNCASETTTGTGMRVDGSLADGLKSITADSYTQTNQGGCGIHVLNGGYAQLSGIFTVCCNEGVICETGGICDMTGSNNSFGTYGLVANGKSLESNTGTSYGADQTGRFIAVDNLDSRPNVNQSVSFDGGSTIYDIWDATDLVAGQSVLTLNRNVEEPIADNSPAIFYVRSKITANSHAFEYVGTGNSIATALPQNGAKPVPENQVIEVDGGQIVYSSMDQWGNFKVGNHLTINSQTGDITGDAVDQKIYNTMIPYILALEE